MNPYEKIGQYEVLGEIGEGNFGHEYRARDPKTGTEVAIKICAIEDEGLRRRFAFEAEEASKLQHANIAAVLGSGEEEGVPFIVQELLSGQGLDQVIRGQAALTPLEKLNQLLQLAEGLAYAHQQGVIHSDLKPSNVRVLESGEVKILDFCIARLASSENQLTQKGVTMGAASYLPPEQVRGGNVDHRSDIFSFGVLAYELLTFERPFRGNTLSALVYQILYKVPLPLTAVWTECPEALSDLIARCLDKKPDRRFQEFAELTPLLRDLKNRLAAGEWPSLQAAVLPDSGHSTQNVTVPAAPDDERVVSQAELSRTALQLTQLEASGAPVGEPDEPLGEFTLAPGEAEKLLNSPIKLGDPDSTQPVDTIIDPDHDARALAAIPPDDSMVLASRGQAIGNLVAEGRLDEALQQLEETVTLQKDGTLTGDVEAIDPFGPEPGSPAGEVPPPLPPAEPPPLPPVGGADEPAARLDHLRARVASKEAKRKLGDEELPAWALKAGPIETTKPLSAPGEPRQQLDFDKLAGAAKTTPPAAPAVPAAAPAASRPLPPWIKLAAAAGLVLALVVLIWVLLPGKERGQEAPAQATAPTPVPAESPVEPNAALGAAELGAVVINAIPWARITEIADAAGNLQELPADASTPLYLELPPGSYAITLQHPEVEELFTCTVEVETGYIESCDTELRQLDPTEYFKSSGWWS